MPTPSFIPVIGRDFSDIGNQQFQWQNFNRGVEESNLARMSHAQDQQNNWLAQVAQMQREDAQRQDAAAQAAQESAAARFANAGTRAENKREFDVGTALQEKQLAEKAKEFQLGQDALDKQTKTDLETVDSLGEHLAPQAKEAAQALKDAIKEKDASIQDYETAKANVPVSEKVSHGKGGDFVPASGYAQDAAAMAEAAAANQKVAEAKARLLRADASHKIAHESWLTLQKSLPKGLFLAPDSTLFNPATKKSYGEPLKEPVVVKKPRPSLYSDSSGAYTGEGPGFIPGYGGPPKVAPPSLPRALLNQLPVVGPLAASWFDSRQTGQAPPAATPSPQPSFFDQTSTGTAPPGSPYQEGQIIRSKSDGKIYRVQNGIPVQI